MASGLLGVATGVLLALTAAPAAQADKVITAETVWRFGAGTYTIDQGEPLTFANNDSLSPGPHNVTASDKGADGAPLFSTDSITAGQTAPVKGAANLKAGSYSFLCTVHPFMTATLVVSDKGAPATPPSSPPPQPAPDTKAPGIDASLGKAKLRAKRFSATVVTDEDAGLRARLTARVRGKTVLVGTASATAAAHYAVHITVRASKSARRALAHAKRATLTLAVEARDAAGNVSGATAQRRLRR